MDLHTFFLYALVTVLMTPLLLVYGLPFILAARVFDHFAQLWFSDRTRFALSCGIASLGLAPAYDVYRAPLPIYLRLCQADTIGAGTLLASFLLTWLVVMLQTRSLSHLLHRPA